MEGPRRSWARAKLLYRAIHPDVARMLDRDHALDRVQASGADPATVAAAKQVLDDAAGQLAALIRRAGGGA